MKVPPPAFLFDLDGTLVDNVYLHVLAWRHALEQAGLDVSVWRIHRRIGMSGGLLAKAVARETGRELPAEEARRLQKLHAEEYRKVAGEVRPLPGARELLRTLDGLRVPWAVATSAHLDTAEPSLRILGIEDPRRVVTRDAVEHAKPHPDLFLAAAARLGRDVTESVVVGDSLWDILAARRARALGVGLLTGGFGEEELVRAGAYRVYEDPAALLGRLDEIGVRAG